MKLQQIIRYRMDFESKAMTASSAFMGLAFFLQSVYFFGFADLQKVSFLQLILQLSLPMLLEAAWFLLLRGFQLPAPGLYGILGASFCVLIMVQTVVYGGIVAAIVAVPTCLIASLGVLAVTGGYLASRFAAVSALLLTVVLRLVLGGLPEDMLEWSILCGLFGMMTLFATLQDPKKAR